MPISDDGVTPSGKAIQHREVGVWTVLIIAVAFWANILRGGEPGDLPGLDAMLTRVLDNGAFDVFAWTLIFARFARIYPPGPASWPRIMTGFAIGVIALAPVRLAPGIGLLLFGLVLVRDRSALPAGRQVGLVMLALALETLWASRLLSIVHVLTARVDAMVVGALFRLFGVQAVTHSNVVENLDSGFSIVIWTYCASSMPLASFTLAFLVTCLYFGHTPRRGDIIWLGMGFAASILLTEMRLMLLGLDEAIYEWWHNGPGVSVYAVAALCLAILFPLLAIRSQQSQAARLAAGRDT